MMWRVPSVAVGTLQPQACVEPMTWALLAAVVKSGVSIQGFASTAVSESRQAVPRITGRPLRHLDGWIQTAEQTLTADTVPVNVDAVLFWMVHDPEKAALEVQNYNNTVAWAAQPALRDIIGRTSLSDLLRGRERIEEELQKLIDLRTNPWGVTVQSVEMRDIVIPASLQDAMSREAQASREKAARVILGQAEVEIADSFAHAAQTYRDNPTALHLRAMNMLYEGLKEKGALMLIPSSAVESMGMGGLMGAAAMMQKKLTESGMEGKS